jgi:ubiquinone/menaquinone biosynthesis C-methylase UbiE
MSPPRKSEIKDRYDQLGGEIYDTRYTEEQTEKYEHILGYLGRGKTLDNGCGTGLFLPKLGEYSVGLDLSSELLSEAYSRVKQGLVQADSENLPFRDNVFDSLVSVTVIQNVPSPETMVAESARVTRPSGPIVISSLKRVYKQEEFRNLFQHEGIDIDTIVTSEKINDWIAVIRNNY